MSRYELSRAELAELLDGEPRYRVDQLWDGLYTQLAEPHELTVLPASLRQALSQREELACALRLEHAHEAEGAATTKWLFSLADGSRIEAVLMYETHRATLCVSSQVGCAMGCTFCATGQMGYARQLSAGEIVEQVVFAARAARASGRRLDNVVFMGMGEPLANYEAVWDAIERIVSDLHLGARHITVSTVGIVPGIRRLATESLQVNLALSLHAGNDELRGQLVPINRRYRLEDIINACEDYIEATSRRISLEWTLIAGVNDRGQDVRELAAIAHRLRAHVNLIALNETPGATKAGLLRPSVQAAEGFRAELRARGVNATLRRTHGRSIDAACGQLAVTLEKRRRPRPITIGAGDLAD